MGVRVGVVVLAFLALGSTSCSTVTHYRPEREISASIPKPAAAERLRAQIDEVFARVREGGSDPGPLVVDAEGFEVRWSRIGEREEKRVAWDELEYRVTYRERLLEEFYALYIFRVGTDWFFYILLKDELYPDPVDRRERIETCIDALESLGARRRPE